MRSEDTSGPVKSAESSAPATFARLIGSRREAAAILGLVPQEQKWHAFDFDANRSGPLLERLSQFKVIHFATHGILDTEHPELSGIVLSLVDENGHSQDGFLRLIDIFNLKLPADLVVLSACETALGKSIGGEGLVGLTRGFMYAGSQRVLASLWKVDDRATAELMKRFYAHMFRMPKLKPPAALRAAQMELATQTRWRSPYYWAGFVLQGEWQ